MVQPFAPNSITAEGIIYKTLQILANGNNWCYASYNELVRKSGFGKTTVIHAVRELIGNQKIKRDKVFDVEKGNLSNRYELLINDKEISVN